MSAVGGAHADAPFTHKTRFAYRSSEAETISRCALINPLPVCYKPAEEKWKENIIPPISPFPWLPSYISILSLYYISILSILFFFLFSLCFN